MTTVSVIDFVYTSNLQNVCVTDPSSKSGINDPEKLLEGVLSQVTGYIEGGCKNEAIDANSLSKQQTLWQD